jgi:hypothetical protein
MIAKQQLKAAVDVEEYLDANGLWTIGEKDGINYSLQLTAQQQGWSIRARPNRPENYTRGFFNRLCLVDFSKRYFPEMRLDSGSSVVIVVERKAADR